MSIRAFFNAKAPIETQDSHDASHGDSPRAAGHYDSPHGACHDDC
jgi:hypothetical protein